MVNLFRRKVGVAEEGVVEEEGDLGLVISVDKKVTGLRTVEELNETTTVWAAI